jgi:hypothetical protein
MRDLFAHSSLLAGAMPAFVVIHSRQPNRFSLSNIHFQLLSDTWA